MKTNKNDAADAEAICEAVARPNMCFVPVKTDEQQAVLSLHRVRQSFVKVRTAQANQIRGLLSEFGEIIPQGIAHIAKRLPEILENLDLPSSFRELLQRLYVTDHLPTCIRRGARSCKSDRNGLAANVPGDAEGEGESAALKRYPSSPPLIARHFAKKN